jgi:hypothetical protein
MYAGLLLISTTYHTWANQTDPAAAASLHTLQQPTIKIVCVLDEG